MIKKPGKNREVKQDVKKEVKEDRMKKVEDVEKYEDEKWLEQHMIEFCY